MMDEARNARLLVVCCVDVMMKGMDHLVRKGCVVVLCSHYEWSLLYFSILIFHLAFNNRSMSLPSSA